MIKNKIIQIKKIGLIILIKVWHPEQEPQQQQQQQSLS